MGDYTKLIVNCEITLRGNTPEEFETIIRETLKPSTSAYHCGGDGLIAIKHDPALGNYSLVLICQKKWGDGISEFIDWLRPYVQDGFGTQSYIACAFDEYSDSPTLYEMEG